MSEQRHYIVFDIYHSDMLFPEARHVAIRDAIVEMLNLHKAPCLVTFCPGKGPSIQPIENGQDVVDLVRNPRPLEPAVGGAIGR